MNKKLPINTDILTWARTSLGLSIAEVAQKMKKAETEISGWEAGEKSPTYRQLEKLAYSVYKRPVAVFFFPEIPEEADLKTDFRTLPDTEIEMIPAHITALYRKAKIFQYNLEELYEGQKPVPNSILDTLDLNENSNVSAIATEVRQILKVSMNEQAGWRSSDAALKAWRSRFEDNGIFVFKDAFRDERYSGFCLYDKSYPVMYLNNSLPDTRLIFTLFHELGHLLFHAGGIDYYASEEAGRFPERYLRIERLCNEFAAKVLVPDSDIDTGRANFHEGVIEGYAGRFSVSREVILRKFFDAGTVSQGEYDSFVRKWQESQTEEKKKPGGNYYLTWKTYLGETYIQTAFRKYYQQKISDVQLSDYLNIKPKNLPGFEHYAVRSEAGAH